MQPLPRPRTQEIALLPFVELILQLTFRHSQYLAFFGHLVFCPFSSEVPGDRECGLDRICNDFTFPQHDYPPSSLLELATVPSVPHHIGPELRLPKFPSRRRSGCPFASSMPVPEAPVHEDYGFVPGQDDVRSPGEVSAVDAETEPHAVEQAAYYQFRLGVSRPDPGHVPASPFWCQVVRHVVCDWLLWLLPNIPEARNHSHSRLFPFGCLCVPPADWEYGERKERGPASSPRLSLWRDEPAGGLANVRSPASHYLFRFRDSSAEAITSFSPSIASA